MLCVSKEKRQENDKQVEQQKSNKSFANPKNSFTRQTGRQTHLRRWANWVLSIGQCPSLSDIVCLSNELPGYSLVNVFRRIFCEYHSPDCLWTRLNHLYPPVLTCLWPSGQTGYSILWNPQRPWCKYIRPMHLIHTNTLAHWHPSCSFPKSLVAQQHSSQWMFNTNLVRL